MSKQCQICNTALEDNSQYCPNCGWELVVVLDSSSEQLKRIINEKKLVYKQNYDRFIKSKDELVKTQEEIEKMRVELANAKEKEPINNAQTLSVSRRLCVLTENHQIIVLNAGEHTFGRLGPATETHFVFNDSELDGKHFALQIHYNLPNGSLYSCKIKSIGNKNTYVNATKKIGTNWETIDANDEIAAGNKKITLVLTK
ncbi:hypothetical protein AGMMS50239_04110 [Bacteroidia bacterium]|nr:hypothetical protein AGMMS50239_04110 [Bacteroidia bacterium]